MKWKNFLFQTKDLPAIRTTLERNYFAEGDTVNGKISFLNQETRPKKVKVELICRLSTTESSIIKYKENFLIGA